MRITARFCRPAYIDPLTLVFAVSMAVVPLVMANILLNETVQFTVNNNKNSHNIY